MKNPKRRNLPINVLEAATRRLNWVFDTFDKICLSFSGGKDSTVLFHLTARIARERGRKFHVLFIDWEAQYELTIDHIQDVYHMYSDVVDHFYWVALPLTTVSGVSQEEPEWIAWEPDVEWVRQPPEWAITQQDYFPFYEYAMTFEEFIPKFSHWLAGNDKLATLIGIRTEESLNRYVGLASPHKLRYAKDKPWTTTTTSNESINCVCYPLYDWRTKDIWIFNARTKLPYNPLYELMYKAGVPFRNMRVCEPFGPEQRKGLWLYHVLEPKTWEKMCRRVCGANSGAIYANETSDYYALKKKMASPPAGHTWRSYVEFLLRSMPQKTAAHYQIKISVYLHWLKEHGYPDGIPEEQANDLGYKDIPSWRRICKALIRNDYWCRTLSFSPTKRAAYDKYFTRMIRKKDQWKLI